MTIFKDHKLNIKQLLNVIPEALLSHLSANTKVDYYSKTLQGKKMFYLLMYGLLENDKLSQSLLFLFNAEKSVFDFFGGYIVLTFLNGVIHSVY